MTVNNKKRRLYPNASSFVALLYRKQLLSRYTCWSLIFLSWSIVCYFQFLSDSSLSPPRWSNDSSSSSLVGEPSRRLRRQVVVKASQLAVNRTMAPRVLGNQERLLSFHTCPPLLQTTSSTTNQQIMTTTTLVTQLTVERFWLVQETCQYRWTKDPMAVTIYFASLAEYQQYAESFQQALARVCPLVDLILYINDMDDSTAPTPYPINLLRNLALEMVQTSHVLVYDVDFVPAVHLADDIRAAFAIRHKAHQATNNSTTTASSRLTDERYQALVVPALQFNVPRDGGNTTISSFYNNNDPKYRRLIPSTFDQVSLCVKTGLCRPFDENQNQAHGATRTDEWLQRKWYHTVPCSDDNNPSNKPLQDLRYVPCIDSPAYEPYLVLPWCFMTQSTTTSSGGGDSAGNNKRSVPYYDERFVGYGWNKIQFIHHLRHLGFLLWVVPAGFLVHVPHPPSAAQRAFSANRLPARQVYQEFDKELQEIHEWKSSNLRTCQHWAKHFANMTYSEAFCRAYV